MVTNKLKFWEAHILAWRNSGLSQKEYCNANEIKKSTLGYWISRLAKTKHQSGLIELPKIINEVDFVEILIKDTLKIRVKQGFNPLLLKDTVKVLETLC